MVREETKKSPEAYGGGFRALNNPARGKPGLVAASRGAAGIVPDTCPYDRPVRERFKKS